MPLCQLDGVFHLSPEKLTNNEPFSHQRNHWISGELVGIIAEGQGCSIRSDSRKWCKMKTVHPSDFVTNSYVESSGTHLVKNHESMSRAIESQFQTSPWVLFCRQTPTLTVLQFIEITICSFYCQAQQRLKETHMYESLNNSHKNSHRNHTNRISTKTSSDQTIDLCVVRDQTTNYFASLGIFMRQGRRTLEVKESLLPPSLSFLPT